MKPIFIAAAAVAVILPASFAAAVPSTHPHSATRAIKDNEPATFHPIVRYSNLWNSAAHAFFIAVEDSRHNSYTFKITDPAEYAQVQTILRGPGGAETDGTSIASEMQTPGK